MVKTTANTKHVKSQTLLKATLIASGIIGLAGMILVGRTYLGGRNKMVFSYLRNPSLYPEYQTEALSRCGDAPFLFPSTGFIGYLWDDSFKLFSRHQGIDIFGGTAAGKTPIYAPYDGFLTREEGWRSSLIIRVPDDPLNPGSQIWLYLTHMADADGNSFIDAAFPAGTYEKRVAAGELLGFQGDYSGNPAKPVGVHLHFSIVRDNGTGHYLNELELNNTLDPTPYFGFELNAKKSGKSEVPKCRP